METTIMEYAQKILVIHRRKALENGKNGTHFKNKLQVSLVCNQNPVLVWDHSSITSSKRWVGGWGQKMAIFDDLQYCKSSKK
jgi:hypothetical protein